MINSIADLLNNLDKSDQEAVWENALKFFESFGFHITNYGIIDKANSDVIGFHSNMADSWMQYYMDSEYMKDDPWVNYVVSNDAPLVYSREGQSELTLEKGTRSEKMVNEAAELGLTNSICIPVHNKFGHLITGFNLGADMNHKDFQKMLDENMQDILMGAAFVNTHLVDMTPKEYTKSGWTANPYYKQLLSDRELEVLKWLCEGNRNDRIAEKMNIASVTVNYHLKEIKRKLGARTREQSVALAYKKGLLL